MNVIYVSTFLRPFWIQETKRSSSRQGGSDLRDLRRYDLSYCSPVKVGMYLEATAGKDLDLASCKSPRLDILIQGRTAEGQPLFTDRDATVISRSYDAKWCRVRVTSIGFVRE